MSWLYKFLLDVIEKKDFCTQCHCTTCGATEFRATLISKLKIYRKIPNITKLSKTNEKKKVCCSNVPRFRKRTTKKNCQ